MICDWGHVFSVACIEKQTREQMVNTVQPCVSHTQRRLRALLYPPPLFLHIFSVACVEARNTGAMVKTFYISN